jgi:hypothetical protein
MNARRPKTSPVAVVSHRTLAALSALAPLLIFGCMARTPLRSAAQNSSEPDETGGVTSEATGSAGAAGGDTAGAAGAGGAEVAGGSVAAGGISDTGGASAGAVAGTVAEGGSSSAAGMTAISSAGSMAGGTTSAVGGATAIGGGASGGGSKSTGGTSATGGTKSTGGSKSTGGTSATGGSKSTGSTSRDGGVAPDGIAAPGTPTITDSGYVTVSAGTTILAGFVSSSAGGSGSSITLTYGPSSFCASGSVGKNSTYNCWATAGFGVNQAQSGASGSSSSLALTGSSITVSYVNKGGSTLELQLFDGSNFWCAYLPGSATPTSKTIAFSSLNTKCWDNTGTSFTSGTPITSVTLVVPGSAAAATPYDFCFLGMTVQ